MNDIIDGLMQIPARISPKYFYDAKGSALFEDITRLQAYYPTRTEHGIMIAKGREMAREIGEQRTLIELGAGNCQKARALCELIRPSHFLAVDISEAFLHDAVAAMRLSFPKIDIRAIAADLTTDFVLPPDVPEHGRLVFYPGSSIGNFDLPEALSLLKRIRALLLDDGALLIGVDLLKNETVLYKAYDDELGVTAAFNLNALDHLNHLIGSDFDTRQWQHRAFFNSAQSRIEMHLEALTDQHVHWHHGVRCFSRGERIHTENSYKYRVDDFVDILRDAGLTRTQVWTDDKAWFAVMLARP
ncbi:MAG: L-histidine N(alpha)-methyltransferase [Burkholderiales bacterium]|nr:L-histidine N(alpha)-methyltransferase [Burkholderiales bacterium]